ncbi:unnamed protein product [Prunus armeniaca]|uniref:Uncharacterized protein n=1 Tax=Prunus armeniaca TaxID=36596 RepID=A0A6J5XBD0_PRUAR|nr:unnamed protein product [Prunus armeniaca]
MTSWCIIELTVCREPPRGGPAESGRRGTNPRGAPRPGEGPPSADLPVRGSARARSASYLARAQADGVSAKKSSASITHG